MRTVPATGRSAISRGRVALTLRYLSSVQTRTDYQCLIFWERLLILTRKLRPSVRGARSLCTSLAVVLCSAHVASAVEIVSTVRSKCLVAKATLPLGLRLRSSEERLQFDWRASRSECRLLSLRNSGKEMPLTSHSAACVPQHLKDTADTHQSSWRGRQDGQRCGDAPPPFVLAQKSRSRGRLE